jgi:hypothetical protein
MMEDLEKFIGSFPRKGKVTRRDLLKFVGKVGIMTVLPSTFLQHSYASPSVNQGVALFQSGNKNTEWLAEARIGGMSVSGLKVDSDQLIIELSRLIKQGVTVIEADSRLSDYLTEQAFAKELQRIKATTKIIQEHGLKVVWYIPALEVITINGLTRKDSFARIHPDWLQLSFDGKNRGVFYGQKVFWVEPNDESAWLCPNSPYREWFKRHLRQLAETGVDGIWLDVPIFDVIVVKWGCSCNYCREKFMRQTGLEFPNKFDIRDKAFWRFIRWRHDTITEFLDDCKVAIESGNPDTVTIAEIVAVDHMGATVHGSEGSSMDNILIVWELDALSDTTAMAEASYDDWMVMHNMYKYCRGATIDRPSWVFCYGYDEYDAQLVLASAVAAQNNPYELRIPKMTSSVGMAFRQMMFSWIEQYSKQIFRSRSLAPAAVIYSERNRDFLDIPYHGGMYITYSAPRRDRIWFGDKERSVLKMKYLGDYRGLSMLLFQNQIPTDIYPISRVDVNLLQNYQVLVLPYMAILTEDEKGMLLKAVSDGATLIVSGPKPGMWDADARPRGKSLWADLLEGASGDRITRALGKGRVCFWKDNVGRKYLKSHDEKIITPLLFWIRNAGVDPWIRIKLPVVVQPYVYEHQTIIHVLNYSWVGALENQPKPISLELSIPWDSGKKIKRIIQSEPQWSNSKTLSYSQRENKVVIPLEVGINALILVDT